MTQGNLAEILKLPHYLQPTDERQRQRVTVKKTLLVYWYTGYKLCGGCASTAGYGPAHFPPKKSLHSVQLPSSGWVRGAGSLWSCDTSFISSSSAATVSTRRVEGGAIAPGLLCLLVVLFSIISSANRVSTRREEGGAIAPALLCLLVESFSSISSANSSSTAVSTRKVEGEWIIRERGPRRPGCGIAPGLLCLLVVSAVVRRWSMFE